jgi:hypothetical protein
MRHPEFLISEGLINLLYFQSLVWIAMPLYPFGSIFSVLFFWANFKFERLVLTHLTSKPSRPWSAADASAVFAGFYNLTLALVFASYYFFLNSAWPCALGGGGSSSGPFALVAGNVAWAAVREKADAARLGWLYSALSSPVLYLALAAVFLLRQLFALNRVDALQQLHTRSSEDARREIAALHQVIARNNQVISAHKGTKASDS